MMFKNVIYCALFLLIVFASCKKFEYSPYQVETIDPDDTPVDLNSTNIQKLFAKENDADDTVTVIFSGDCQRYYDELDLLVKKVNTIPNVDFLIMDGDIADFGLLQEYLWICKQLNGLNCPYLCAIGNHDFTANHGDVYTRIFGQKNYSFTYKKYKFLFHDSNSREYNFNGTVPNMFWLQDELNDSVPTWFVGVSHVPPYDVDFDKTLEHPYKDLFASTNGFIASLNGHVHSISDSLYYNDSVRYLTSNSVEKKEVLLLKFINGTIIKQYISY